MAKNAAAKPSGPKMLLRMDEDWLYEGWNPHLLTAKERKWIATELRRIAKRVGSDLFMVGDKAKHFRPRKEPADAD
jgi:hypothetical protein